MTQRIARGELSAEYAVDYVIGSGNAAFGYLVSAGNAVFQSPIAYYAKRKRWGAAPGMERYAAPDFTRPVTPGVPLVPCRTPSAAAANRKPLRAAGFRGRGDFLRALSRRCPGAPR